MSPRGGYRKGAGRPPGTGTGRATPIMIRVAPAELAEIDAGLSPGETRSQLFTAAALQLVRGRSKSRP